MATQLGDTLRPSRSLSHEEGAGLSSLAVNGARVCAVPLPGYTGPLGRILCRWESQSGGILNQVHKDEASVRRALVRSSEALPSPQLTSICESKTCLPGTAVAVTLAL